MYSLGCVRRGRTNSRKDQRSDETGATCCRRPLGRVAPSEFLETHRGLQKRFERRCFLVGALFSKVEGSGRKWCNVLRLLETAMGFDSSKGGDRARSRGARPVADVTLSSGFSEFQRAGPFRRKVRSVRPSAVPIPRSAVRKVLRRQRFLEWNVQTDYPKVEVSFGILKLESELRRKERSIRIRRSALLRTGPAEAGQVLCRTSPIRNRPGPCRPVLCRPVRIRGAARLAGVIERRDARRWLPAAASRSQT